MAKSQESSDLASVAGLRSVSEFPCAQLAGVKLSPWEYCGAGYSLHFSSGVSFLGPDTARPQYPMFSSSGQCH